MFIKLRKLYGINNPPSEQLRRSTDKFRTFIYSMKQQKPNKGIVGIKENIGAMLEKTRFCLSTTVLNKFNFDHPIHGKLYVNILI